MKRGLLLGFAGLFILTTGIWWSNFNGVEKEYYEPREEGIMSDGPQGYLEYMTMLRANPATGKVDPADVIKARKQVAELAAKKGKKSAIGLDWDIVGPTNVGGRTRAMIIDNSNPNTFYMGSIGGGFFKSTNAGASWELKSDPASNHAVSSIAQAADGTIYYGTGEDHYASANGGKNTYSPGFIGGGVYKSTDGGETFSVLASTVPPPNTNSGTWSSVSRLRIHQASGKIYAGTMAGLRVSTDGGQNWSNPLAGMLGGNLPAQDVEVTASGVVWVYVDRYIYKSDNTGANFTEVTGGTVPRNSPRCEIAVSPEDENYVYIVQTSGSGSFAQAFQSKDGGSTWTEIGSFSIRLNPHGTVGGWANSAVVDAHNKERLLVAGLDLWEWSEQFGWQQLSLWSLVATNPVYVHADIHDMIYSASDPNTFYVISDGGITRTQNNGVTFQEMNNNYNTTTYYDMAVGPDGRVFGGAQDMGTMLVDPTSTFPTRATVGARPAFGGGVTYRITGGDGSSTVMSKLVPGLIGSASNRFNQRLLEYGASLTPDVVDDARMDPGNYYSRFNVQQPQWSIWMPPVVLWEKLEDNKSWDSVRYGADTIDLSLGFGNGLTSFKGTFGQFLDFDVLKEENGSLVTDSAIFDPEGVTISTDDGRMLVSDANGTFTGDGSGTFNPSNGEFQITFNSPVAVEIFGKAPTKLEAGMIIRASSLTGDFDLFDTVVTPLSSGQSAKVQDPVQAMFFLGLTSHRVNKIGGNFTRNHFGGIWMTRNYVSEPQKNPDWVHIGNLNNNESVTAMTVSNDGDILYVGTNEGRIYRFSNISNARDSASADIDSLYISNTFVRASTSIIEATTLGIGSNGRPITSLSVHPNDAGRVMATVGNYGFNSYVFFNDAADAPNAPAFSVVQGDLPAMPVYASTFNFTGNQNQVILGTEMGIFTTDDIEAANVSWVQENNQFASVPVFDLRQDLTVRYDLKDENDYEGTIYAATHGLGFWKTTSTANFVTIGQEEHEAPEVADLVSLDVYPNPATDVINIELDLSSRMDVDIYVLDLNGKIVKQVRYDNLASTTESVELRVANLPHGAYVINMLAGKSVKTGKFIKE